MESERRAASHTELTVWKAEQKRAGRITISFKPYRISNFLVVNFGNRVVEKQTSRIVFNDLNVVRRAIFLVGTRNQDLRQS